MTGFEPATRALTVRSQLHRGPRQWDGRRTWGGALRRDAWGRLAFRGRSRTARHLRL